MSSGVTLLVKKSISNLSNIVLESRNGVLIFKHIFSDFFSSLSAFENGMVELLMVSELIAASSSTS